MNINLRPYYAARAHEYDKVYQKPERQSDLRAVEAWLPQRFEGRTVLEVACGTGYWTQFIAPVADRLVALDAAPETMDIARTRVLAETVRFVVGDAYALPTHLGPFDAAFAGFWFSHVPISRRREFLAGLGRAVEPGAKVVLLDNRFVDGSSTPISESDEDGNTYQDRVLKNFPGAAELHACIEGLGTAGYFRRWDHFWAFEYSVAS